MADNYDASGTTIKLLVDALSQSLQNLSDKISNYQPILNQITKNSDNESKTINEIIFQCKDIAKTLSAITSDFYSRTDTVITREDEIKRELETLAVKLEEFHKKVDSAVEREGEIKHELEILTVKLDEFHTKIDEYLKHVNTDFDTLKNNTEPVGKLFIWLTKPLGFIIFIIGMILASITITKSVQAITDYFQRPAITVPVDTSK